MNALSKLQNKGEGGIDPEGIASGLLDLIHTGAWFSAVGEKSVESEAFEIRSYLDGLDLDVDEVVWLDSWQAAGDIAKHPDWSPAWWDAEENQRTALFADAVGRWGEEHVLNSLARVNSVAAHSLHGPAAVAAARDAVSDAGVSRAAAGAAAQSCYLAALARLSGRGADHPFEAKLRLFAGGRWPLCLVGKQFYIL
ncbi:MAG: hypothetical protein V3R73_02185 [Sphingomonadales bacterium]